MLLCGITLATHAQWMPDIESELLIQQGINRVYNLELDSALVLFEEVVRMHPRHPAGYFFVAMIDWMQILVNLDDESLDERFFESLEQVINLSDDMLTVNPEDLSALFFKGGAIGFRGRLRAHRGSWVRAANDGRRALPIVRKASKLDPENADVLLGTGIYNYYAAVVPEMYPIVKPLMVFFPSGDKEEGLAQLKHAAEHAHYAGIESAYFLMQILYFNEKQYAEGYDIARMLHTRFPNNPLFHRYYGRYNVSLARWDTAYEIFNDIARRFEDGWLGYNKYAIREAEYYRGQYLFNRNDFEEALPRFQAAHSYSTEIDGDNQSGFIIMSALRIGQIYDALGERDRALLEYRKVRAKKDYQGSRQLADRYIREPFMKGNPVKEISPNVFSP
jgi:tetratricopeptide (TPR) repeat protein